MTTQDSLNDGTSQGDGTQTNQSQAKTYTRTMFLEYDRWREGQHNISAIIKEPGSRGKVVARIFTEFSGENGRPTYTAKDLQGNILFPPNPKLWEIKKSIRENARPLLEKARLFKPTPVREYPQKKKEPILQKEVKAIGNELVNEVKEFGVAARDIVFGTGRKQDLKKIRQRKIEKVQGRELEP